MFQQSFYWGKLVKNDIILLISILILGILAKSNVTAAAATVLLLIKFFNLERFLPLVERRSLEVGLLFLNLAVLIPMMLNDRLINDILKTFTSMAGVIAIVAGIIASQLNASGFEFINEYPQYVIGIIIGTMIGIIFFRGFPVGPLMAGGVMLVFLTIFEEVTKFIFRR